MNDMSDLGYLRHRRDTPRTAFASDPTLLQLSIRGVQPRRKRQVMDAEGHMGAS